MNSTIDIFTVICAWCESVLSTGEKAATEPRRTHSICERCFEKMRIEIEMMQREKRTQTKLAS
jgi:RNase P subunit RPR2